MVSDSNGVPIAAVPAVLFGRAEYPGSDFFPFLKEKPLRKTGNRKETFSDMAIRQRAERKWRGRLSLFGALFEKVRAKRRIHQIENFRTEREELVRRRRGRRVEESCVC